jgi:hypothetical protein
VSHRTQSRRRGRVAAIAAAIVSATVALAAPARAAEPSPPSDEPVAAAAAEPLSVAVRRAVNTVRFDQVVDFGPFEGVCPGASWCPSPAATVAASPNVDIAVIRLDRAGRPVEATNILVSRDYPRGRVVGLGSGFNTEQVRFRRWDIDRWNGGTIDRATGQVTAPKGWTTNPALTDSDDIVPGRSGAPLEFMEPYSASLFKVLVAFHTFSMIDDGLIGLDNSYVYTPSGGGCPGGTSAGTKTNRQWLDLMITSSDNQATCALLKQMHDLGQIDDMNAGFAAIGLPTLQVNGTSPTSGGNWVPGQIHLTSMELARLFLIVNSSPGTLWRVNGTPITADVLSANSRALFKTMLGEQGFNEVLSTTNWCGLDYPAPGIPAQVSERWIDPSDGSVTVEGIPYFEDVRPCNDAAQVTFSHKTGLTYNYGSDGGIVNSLPGARTRNYIVVVNSNLGYRYSDPSQAASSSLPCFSSGVCYTEKFGQLGRLIDNEMRKR